VYEPESVQRLKRDSRIAAATLSDEEARYLVDAYYLMQEDRKRAHNQVRALDSSAEPNAVIAWLAEQSELLENEVKRMLDIYTDNQPIGMWLKSIYGIGPVIAAGLMAHIDITKVDSAGKIWTFAGLDPTRKWEKGQKRPWNATLKTLCWKAGQSFMKFSNQRDCTYGHYYRERKEYEVKRNERGENAERCKLILAEKKFGKDTEAFKHYSAGKLPPAHVDAMARRAAVKLFLSHLFLVWFWLKHDKLPPAPYAIAILGHKDFRPPPNAEDVPGLAKALSHWK